MSKLLLQRLKSMSDLQRAKKQCARKIDGQPYSVVSRLKNTREEVEGTVQLFDHFIIMK